MFRAWPRRFRIRTNCCQRTSKFPLPHLSASPPPRLLGQHRQLQTPGLQTPGPTKPPRNPRERRPKRVSLRIALVSPAAVAQRITRPPALGPQPPPVPAHPPLAHSPRLCPPARERCVNPLIVPRWKARSGPRGSRQGLARARTRIDPVKNMEEEGRSQQEQGCIGMQRGDQDGKVQERRERRQTRTGWPPRGPGTRPRPLKQGSQIHDTKRSP